MRANDGTRTAAEVLIDQLVIHGVRQMFCVPGESYIAALDACHDRDIAVTICRQESGAAIMAEAQGKATGRPGICFVTRGPGATNAAAGVHIARQDSTPMILFVGQIAREMREREAFQELDYRAVFGTMAKWATEIDDPTRIPELISRAFYTATSGRPGPVVIALPEDMLVERIAVPDAPAFEPVETWPGATDMSRLQKLLWAAERPDLAARRQPLVGAGLRRGRALRAALCAAGRDHVPARASVRSGPSLLRRRSRHRAQSQAPGAREGRRSHPARRRPAGRDALAELHAARHSGAAPNSRPCISRCRGTRPRLPRASAHQCRADRFCRGARRPAAAGRVALAGGNAGRPCRLPRLDGQADQGAGAGQSRRDCRGIARPASRRRGDLQRRRQFLHLGAPLSRATADTAPSSRRSRAPWATGYRRPSA